MSELPVRHLALYAAGLLVIALLGVRYLGRGDDTPAAPAAAPAIRVQADAGSGAAVTVHVAGAVRRPGVYRMRAGSRVDDAVRRAGGAIARADLGAVNLAAKVEDGRQVLVPRRPPSGVAGGTAVAGSAPAPGQPLNLNTATLEQLDTLDGVGPATAQSILDQREERGSFGSVEELGEIPGIGEKRLASLREQVRV